MKITKKQLKRIIRERLDESTPNPDLVHLGHQIYAEVAYDMVDTIMNSANVPLTPENKEQVQTAVDELFSSSEFDDLLVVLGSLSKGDWKW